MATYIPNADTLTQPTEDKPLVTAAAEFRAVKGKVESNQTRIDTLETKVIPAKGVTLQVDGTDYLAAAPINMQARKVRGLATATDAADAISLAQTTGMIEVVATAAAVADAKAESAVVTANNTVAIANTALTNSAAAVTDAANALLLSEDANAKATLADLNAADALAQVESAVAGSVVSFNGRAGAVIPQAGDYNKAQVGLENVDNTADADKPVSNATQTALNTKTDVGHTHVLGDLPATVVNTTGVQTLTNKTLSGVTVDGDTAITGTGRRIRGDFTNATHANRTAFQSSTVNGGSAPFIIPNGTSNDASIVVAHSSAAANCAFGQLRINAAEVGLVSGTLGTGTALPLGIFTGGTERMRVTPEGNVGIGTNAPGARLDVTGTIRTNGNSSRILQRSDNNTLVTEFGVAVLTGFGDSVGLNNPTPTGIISFGTNTTERVRIDASGALMVGTTSADTGGIVSGTGTWRFQGTAADQNPGLLRHLVNGSSVIQIFGNGNVQNLNNSYGAISDAKLKENITDATPKLEKLNQVRVVSYNLIGDGKKQIGVIAQDLEQVFPSLVEETPDLDAEGNDLGTATKSVKYSVFVPLLIKAMQEQQALIQSLTARITALESAGSSDGTAA